ncbi:MAG: hypothetical protein M1824_004264 [Vezdaea acicularis]|nr:MAG: hypothetical protein M1824_004264 [Vezdaea acicularis]
MEAQPPSDTVAKNPGIAVPNDSRTKTTEGSPPPTSYTLGPDSNSDAKPTPSALGSGSDKPDKPDLGDPADDLDGEQMRAPGEGDVMRAQQSKTGMGEQEEIGGDLDRKKIEQQGKRQSIQDQRQHGVDVDGDTNRSGPAAVEGGVSDV